jgi:peptidoglycan/xylan/chitin deacetylase (PgdA/CDA1 family)
VRTRARVVVGVVALLAALLATLPGASPASAGPRDCPPPHRWVLTETPATAPRTVALTFDDGPSPRWTPQVLDVLRRHNVRATFFVIGSNVDAHPALARRIVAEGHVIANHTQNHPMLTRLPAGHVAAEIDAATNAIVRATGVRPCFFRGPGGTHSGLLVQSVAHSRNLTIAGWNRDPYDWRSPAAVNPFFQQGVVHAATAPGSNHPIVLLHDGSPGNFRQNTVDAVERIVVSYKSRGFLFTDPAGRAIPPVTAIQHRHEALGGIQGPLGLPLSAEIPLARDAGRFVRYQGGSVYWTRSSGAHEVRGAIRDAWGATGWENGFLGYPRTGELATPRVFGRFNHFSGGSLYWSPATGAHPVRGAIRDRWASLGWEGGVLGFPTSGERVASSGRRSEFQRGSVFWSAATGAHDVYGAIRTTYLALGAERGALGFPTRGEHAVPGGRRSTFTGGSITWSSATGTTVTYGFPDEQPLPADPPADPVPGPAPGPTPGPAPGPTPGPKPEAPSEQLPSSGTPAGGTAADPGWS